MSSYDRVSEKSLELSDSAKAQEIQKEPVRDNFAGRLLKNFLFAIPHPPIRPGRRFGWPGQADRQRTARGGRRRGGDRPLARGDPTVPLARSELLVAHTVRFDGQGRDGVTGGFFAFPAAGGTIPSCRRLPRLGKSGNTIPPATTARFRSRAQKVRLFPGNVVRIDIRPGEGGKLVLSLGDKSLTLAPGEEAVLSDLSSELAVSEKPLMAADVKSVLPGEDHGQGEIPRGCIVKFRGRFPAATQPARRRGRGGHAMNDRVPAKSACRPARREACGQRLPRRRTLIARGFSVPIVRLCSGRCARRWPSPRAMATGRPPTTQHGKPESLTRR